MKLDMLAAAEPSSVPCGQQHRQLGDISRYAPCFILGEHCGDARVGDALARVDIAEGLPLGIGHLELTGNLLNGLRWWKARRGHRGIFARNLATSAFAASCTAVATA